MLGISHIATCIDPKLLGDESAAKSNDEMSELCAPVNVTIAEVLVPIEWNRDISSLAPL
jgi:hypothetical protein